MTQPICAYCWPTYMPDRDPRYRVQATAVACAFCGKPTCAGLRAEVGAAPAHSSESEGVSL